MSEPSSETATGDEQDEPRLLDRILGRDSGGSHRQSGDDQSGDDAERDGDDAERDGGAEQDGGAGQDDDAEKHADAEQDGGGEPSVGAMPAADEVDQEEIEEERAKRLDPENRPENVEIDNTQRDFDSQKGMFTDAEGYDDAETKYDDDAF